MSLPARDGRTSDVQTWQPLPRPRIVSESERERSRSETLLEVRPLASTLLLGALAMWAVVGLALWISVMLFALARFAIAVVARAVGAGETTEAVRGLRRAAGLYRRGFVVGLDAVFPIDGERTVSE